MSELNAITKRLEEIENRRQRYVDGLATQHGLPVVPAPSYLNDTQFLLEQLKEAQSDAIKYRDLFVTRLTKAERLQSKENNWFQLSFENNPEAK